MPDALRIDRTRLAARMHSAARDWPLEIVDITGSTNADLAALLKTLPRHRHALAQPQVRIAYEQSAGRGRQGRPWFAQPGQALLCSVACVLPRAPEALSGLSLAVGVALAEALGSLPLAAGHSVALKWPNDLLAVHEGAPAGKLCGILIESVWHTAEASAVVIGFGINVHGAQHLAAEIEALRARDAALAPALPPTALDAAWPDANLTDLCATVLDALAGMLDGFAHQGFAPFLARWHALHAYAGHEVALLERGEEVARGIAAGVDEQGHLLLDTATGRIAATTGDVSMRAIPAQPTDRQGT